MSKATHYFLKYGQCALWGIAFFIGISLPIAKAAHNQLCRDAITRVEKHFGLPSHLLLAIALTESGRSTPNGIEAFPWTVTAQQKGHFFNSKKDAIAFTRQQQLNGVKNIDVGCLQINLKYHKTAFRSLRQAFDPYHNALYAGRLLKKSFHTQKNWRAVIRHYHSSSNSLGQPYFLRVMRLYVKLHRTLKKRQVAQNTFLPEIGSAVHILAQLNAPTLSSQRSQFPPLKPSRSFPSARRTPFRTNQQERLKQNFKARQPASIKRRIQNYSTPLKNRYSQ